jgi:hypothetical protein
VQDDEKIVVDEIHQRIDMLKQRRRNDKISQILSSAAEGDLVSLTAALKVVWNLFPCFNFLEFSNC